MVDSSGHRPEPSPASGLPGQRTRAQVPRGLCPAFSGGGTEVGGCRIQKAPLSPTCSVAQSKSLMAPDLCAVPHSLQSAGPAPSLRLLQLHTWPFRQTGKQRQEAER